MTDDKVTGCDISWYQDNNSTTRSVDFEKMKANGAKFVYTKATQCNWTDEDFHTYWSNAKKAGLLRGAYHFLTWTGATPEAQADYFWSVMKDDPGELPMVVDFEWWSVIPSNAFDYLYRFLERLKFYTTGKGIKLCIYTAKGFWDQYGTKTDYWKQYLIWLASYNTNPPAIPAPWQSFFIHQYTSHGDGPAYGVESGNIDLDWFYGTYEDFLTACGISNTGTPPEPQDPPSTGGNSMYESNATSVYLDDTIKVTDWDAFASSADVFFVRAVKTYLVGGMINYDKMLETGTYMLEDANYKANYLALKQRGKKVFAVCEYNNMYDCETSWNRSDQAKAWIEVLKAAGNYVPDGLVVKLERINYVQYQKTGLQTDGNLIKGLKQLFADLYNSLRISIFGWTLLSIAHQTTPGYNYQAGLISFLDPANAGEPSFSFGFSYIPTYWSVEKLNGRTFTKVSDLAKEIKPLTTEEALSLKIGSNTGWLSKAGFGQPNHSFWSFNLGSYLSSMTDVAGNKYRMEPFIWDCDKTELYRWMGWSEDPGTGDPGGGTSGGGTGTDDTTITDLKARIGYLEQEMTALKLMFETFSKR